MFCLTEQEKRVILFLSVFSLAGLLISRLNSKHSFVRKSVNTFSNLGKVDLNSVDKDRLMKVPGIGEKLASRIIEYRKENGFSEPNELKKIKGMNEYRFKKMEDYIYIQ